MARKRQPKDLDEVDPALTDPAHLTTAQRQARNDQIVAMVAKGMTYPHIGSLFNISRQQIGLIMKEFREANPSLRRSDPLEIIDLMLEGLQFDLDELVSTGVASTNPAIKIAAIRTRAEMRDRIVALLQATGVLPHDLGTLRVDIDVRYISQQVLVILNKYGVPLEAKKELLELLRSGAPDGSVNN